MYFFSSFRPCVTISKQHFSFYKFFLGLHSTDKPVLKVSKESHIIGFLRQETCILDPTIFIFSNLFQIQTFAISFHTFCVTPFYFFAQEIAANVL